jgi:chaperonin GroES
MDGEQNSEKAVAEIEASGAAVVSERAGTFLHERIYPVRDFHLVKFPRGEEMRGRIVVPEGAQSKLRCKVLRSGPGRVTSDGVRVPMSAQPGDWVVVPQSKNADERRFVGLLIPSEDKSAFYVLAHDSEILGVEQELSGLPLHQRIAPARDLVLARFPRANRSAAGLHIPEAAQRRTRGFVIAAGPGRVLDNGSRSPMSATLGDWIVVIPSKFGEDGKLVGTTIDDDSDPGSEYRLIPDQEILATERDMPAEAATIHGPLEVSR